MSEKAVDILAFGAHPDDIEIGAGGLLAKESNDGRKIIMVDFTVGEMGTNGTPKIRHEEAQCAAKVLGVSQRICLGFKDRSIIMDHESIFKCMEVIREYQPKLILFPYHQDKHPDHNRVAMIVNEAILNAGLLKIESEFPHWKTPKAMQYYINTVEEVSCAVDISEFISKKEEALLCHETQFLKNKSESTTRLNEGYLDYIRSRDRYWGYQSGVQYAEVFHMKSVPCIDVFKTN